MTDLSALIARVEEGAGPDRGLDAAVWFALIEKPEPPSAVDRDMVGKWPAYSSSLDEVLSLIEQKLPGAGVDCHIVPGNDPPCDAYIWPAERSHSIRGDGTSLARALLAATLRALSALEGSKADLADATPNPPASP